VSFEVADKLSPPDACHCSQCRKQSGHFWASTNVKRSDFTLRGDENVTWYKSSEKVRRGFCATCGSFLFWDPVEHDYIAIGMGSLEAPTGTVLEKHIFTSRKGDYYQIADDLPQSEDY
jgi:hypothetical protein